MKLDYRPEIDGLRAIAVSVVILYHAKLSVFGYEPFKGGFIGVDIFFVISGYLITSIIFKELDSTGTFSFKYFYERRIRRILPALLMVMLISLPLAWIFLFPSNLVDFSKSIIYSLGFSSNFYFHHSGQLYGAESGLLKPFLHTWSLSIEEQYYILFPLILFVIFKYFRKYLIHILIFGFILSLGLADWGSRRYPSFYFYILPSRGWELLAGSILAYFEITLKNRSQNQIFNLTLPSVGLILICHSIFFFNDKMFHPSFYTLSPILGVCLIIWFSNKNELVTKILSTKIMVGIGLISYSLYLFHYPIFAFARITGFSQISLVNKFLVGLVVIILSIISYYFIEKPSRNKQRDFIKIFKIIFFTIIMILIFNSLVLIKNGKLNKWNTIIEKQIESPLFEAQCKFSSNQSNFTDESFFNEEFLKCKKKFKKFILILGDSHSIDLFNSISKLSKKNEFIVGLNKGWCRPYTPHKMVDNCHYSNALKFIEQNENNLKMIFFTHKGSYFLTNKKNLPISNQAEKTINYLKEIKKITNKLLFIGPHLEPNIQLNRKTLIKYFKNRNNFNDNVNYDLLKVDEILKKTSKDNNIDYLSKIDVIKYNFKEDFVVDGKFTFSDTDHWSEFGEIYFGKKLVFNSIINKILFP